MLGPFAGAETRDGSNVTSFDPPPWRRPEDPRRAYVTEPLAIRALAHSGRQLILRRLQADGPATATDCAQYAGMTPSAASYHLRQLARYGFVAPAPSRGDRRERLWEAKFLGYRIDDVESSESEMSRAELELARATVHASNDLIERWFERWPRESHTWRSAAMLGTKAVRVNAEELGGLFERLAAAIEPYLANRRPREEAPPDARLVHIDLRMFPWED